MSDEKKRNEPGQVTDQAADRHGEGEPDFEGHGNRGGDQVTDQVADRHGEGEPDFEGHRFSDKHTEKHTEKHTD